MALFSKLGRYQQTALLILRIGLGAMMVWHGYPKLIGGPDKWAAIGKATHVLGLHDFPSFWGFMAAVAEAVGGLCLIVGFFFRPACLLLLITMIVAALKHLSSGPFGEATHAIELGVVFLALFIIGPGKYSVDKG
jgi:putative oxidoreductase